MSLNVELLNKVRKHILARPARLRMEQWIRKGQPGEVFETHTPGWNEPKIYKLPDCGTVGCIAGWTVQLAKPEEAREGNIPGKACELLGINHWQEPFELFHVSNWPKELEDAFLKADTQRKRANVVAKVIDRYIKEYGKKPEDPEYSDDLEVEEPESDEESEL